MVEERVGEVNTDKGLGLGWVEEQAKRELKIKEKGAERVQKQGHW